MSPTEPTRFSFLHRDLPRPLVPLAILALLAPLGYLYLQPRQVPLDPQLYPNRAPRSAAAFDLDHALIPIDEIHSGGPAKDGIPALTDPHHVPAAEARFLQPASKVVGVQLGVQTRAYPIPILDWHECINDTLGGVPVAVTYCPLCASALVFHRQVGGEVREFGISGRLYQSNVLLYDRQPDRKKESLWSQALMRAVTGPAAAQRLRLQLLDSTLTDWQSWRRDRPETTVVSHLTGHARDYFRSPYDAYFNHDRLMFHVKGTTNRRPGLDNKSHVVVVQTPQGMRAYPLADLAAAPGRRLIDTLDTLRLRLQLDPASGAVDVQALGNNGAPITPQPAIQRAYVFWFAWDAMHPNGDVYQR